LGEKCIAYIREQLLADFTLDAMREKVRAIRLVDTSKDAPTEDDIERMAPYTDLGVSNKSTSDWYCLTRHLQGNVSAALDVGIMSDDSEFIADSLMCEWAYVINLDEKVLEIYKGFQGAPHAKGRYCLKPVRPTTGTQYYQCALIATIPLYELPPKLIDAIPRDENDE
jgi:hypothetical protein